MLSDEIEEVTEEESFKLEESTVLGEEIAELSTEHERDSKLMGFGVPEVFTSLLGKCGSENMGGSHFWN